MTSLAAHRRGPGGLRLGRYLPLSVLVTLAVLALPLLAVGELGPARSPWAVVLHVLAAVAVSIAVARLLALAWTRHPHSNDLVFGDLLIWGWARRAWADHRLERVARELGDFSPGTHHQGKMLQRLSALLDARDPYTHGHSRRVARHAERIAQRMGLSRELVAKVRTAALVHDIGKINVPRPILTKPGRLTDSEFGLAKRHAADGAALVAKLGDPELAAIVRHHHERLDGRGYPDALAGHDIPLGARIIAVADTFDAITSVRPYRKTRPHKAALEIICREAGTQLDPGAVDAFLGYYASRRSVGWITALVAAPQRLLSSLGGVESGLAVGAAPVAQGACGVGAAALIGACLASPGVGADVPAPVAPPEREASALSAEPGRAGTPVPAGSTPAKEVGRRGASSAPPEQRREREARRRSDGAEGGPPAPDTPVPESAEPGAGLTTEAPVVGGVPVPEPKDVAVPVKEALPPAVALPEVDVPEVDVPEVGLPPVQVPGLQLPQAQLPQVRVPVLGGPTN